MHIRSVLFVLGNLLLLLAALLLVPLAAAIIIDDAHLALEQGEILGFLGAIAAAGIGGLALRTLFETDLSRVAHREAAAIVTFSWVVFSLVGCIPFIVSGAAGFTSAFFETMSGFSTTGATIFPKVELLPSGLQLWRHQTQWMGGMGIVVLSVAVMPMLGAGGYRMFKAETPGGSTFERSAPRIKDTAKVLWMLYLGMSALEVVLLRAGGMGFYDAICHTFTTMSTGGFSTRSASIGGWPSPFIQWTVVGFMFLAGVNFSVYQQLIGGARGKALRDVELQVYALVALAAGALCFGVLYYRGATGGTETTLRASFFQAISIGTTTGFGTADFDRWPDLLRMTMVLLMFMGGCAGSTAGGMKVMRFVIFVKASVIELRRSINPRAVLVTRVGERALDRETVSNVMGFILMWISFLALAAYLLTALGMDMTSAFSAATACIGNIGPGLGTVGPSANYAHVPAAGKWILVFCMLLGRLELYSVLTLALRRTWIR